MALECDLAVVGGGFTGLWTALLAKERDPDRDVVLLEADRIGWQASGRNGGFCMSTLTHGFGNGVSHFPEEIESLERLGLANLDEIERAVARYGIDCDWRRVGEIDVAVAPWQVNELARGARRAGRRGPRGGVARRRGDAGRDRLADVSGRSVEEGRLCDGRPGAARLGTRAGRPRPRRAHL